MPWDGSKLDDVTKLLIEGRERIEQGWCQGSFEKDGSVCVLGALGYHRAVYGRKLYKAIQRLSRHIPGGISSWNDAAGRTKDEVLEAFSRAIAMSSEIAR